MSQTDKSDIPSLKGEVDELKDVDSIIMETFKHCDNMKTDILEYSLDVKKDLTNFKHQIINLSEIQKDISGLTTAITRLESYDLEDFGTDPKEIEKTFERIRSSAMEDQYIPDEVERIIAAVDSYINGQEEDLDVEDSELLVTTTIESYKDPLTKAIIQDPVKSTTCKHVFDRSSIFKYLQRSSRCPYTGCSVVLKREDLVDDLETKRKLLNMK